MKKQDFIANVYERVNKDTARFTKNDIKEIYDEIFNEIVTQVKNGEDIDISTLGKFKLTKRPARKGINPMTKEPIDIPETNVVKFKMSASLKRRINE